MTALRKKRTRGRERCSLRADAALDFVEQSSI
jgi:hypothetical protein